MAPSSPVHMLADRLDAVHCTPFDGGGQRGSPSLTKRLRVPSGPPPLVPLPLPMLADISERDAFAAQLALEQEGVAEDEHLSVPASTWLSQMPSEGGQEPPAWSGPEANSGDAGQMDATVSQGTSTMLSHRPRDDWRMVLYHDRNIVLYNPTEKPHFRSRRLSVEEPSTELSNASGRCPLCRQSLDSRFAFVAQAYFDLLQKMHRSATMAAAGTTAEWSVEQTEEIDLGFEADLYRILGISKKASIDDIKRAYRKRSLRYHPDKNLDDPHAKGKFQKIAEAFSVLSDEKKRQKYDHSGDMDLDDFDIDEFMNMVNQSGKKRNKPAPPGEMDLEEIEIDQMHEMEDFRPELLSPLGTPENPFMLPPECEVPVDPCIGLEGGAEAEASAAASLRHLPPGLLNTGYYARFFVQTKELGSGSFGSVYLCRHVLDDLTLGDYAVKKVAVGDDKTWLRDMIREVKTFERLHHPNIVEYKHSWLELSRRSPFCPFVPFLFILMQYCNGGSLDDLIWHDGDVRKPRRPYLTLTQIWRFLFDILLGLQHLHRQGILHRDLKPTNILLQWPDGPPARSGRNGATLPHALLSDFGTATPLGEDLQGRVASRGYTGTVEYTAPELLQGGDARDYSEKSDMWSLGIALYAMCFSSLPFHDDDPSVLKAMIRSFVDERRGDDATAWLPPDKENRLGALRLVCAALLAFDADRRPAATDLLENGAFRLEAKRHAHYNVSDMSADTADIAADSAQLHGNHYPHQQSALPDSRGHV